jgi:hypothetical protein
VQIHLQQNRTDLALKEAQRARKWAQDSLLVNIAESWIGMREVWSLRPFTFLHKPRQHFTDTLPGRRKVPIRILRLRRTSHNLPIHLPALTRRTSRIRTPPRPPPRSRSRPPTSPLHRPQVRRHYRKPHCPEHPARQEGGDTAAEDPTAVLGPTAPRGNRLGSQERRVRQGSE